MKHLILNLFTLFAAVVTINTAHATEIAVLMSSDAAIYQEALNGFKESVANRTFKVQYLTDRKDSINDQLKIIRTLIEPEIIYVIGTPALEAVVGKITHIPIVHSMVFNPTPGTLTEGKNITGVSMIPAHDKTVSLIKELNPKIRRVGVMYDPGRSQSLYWQAQSAAQKEGIQLIDRKIRSPGEVAAALKSFESEIDLLWLWPDERFLADEIIQRIVLFSYEHKIPVLGLSERHTQMGTLLSLSYGSAKDMGKQAGELVLRVLGRTDRSIPRLSDPREVKLTVNLKAARKINFKIPDSIVQRADNAIKAPVYKDGDWWVFRLREIAYSGKVTESTVRVDFRNGEFETDDVRVLSGGDIAGTPGFLPFATFHFTDLQRQWLKFPMLPGTQWNFRYQRSRLNASPHYIWADADVETVGSELEATQTPNGSLPAIRIERADTVDGGGYLTYFYSPEAKSVIKLRADAEIAVSSMPDKVKYELDLISYGNESDNPKDETFAWRPEPGRRSGSVINTPVYVEGESWLYRIRTTHRSKSSTSTARVTYRNGQFQSSDPRLLSGSDKADPTLQPFATLYFSADPERQWFQFPLSPGNSWRFQYDFQAETGPSAKLPTLAVATVSGQKLQEIAIAAGSFEAIRIERKDTGRAFANLAYYYSPKTKSVVKLRTSSRLAGSTDETTYELELLEYVEGEARDMPQLLKESGIKTADIQTQLENGGIKAPVYTDGDWWVYRLRESYDGKVQERRLRVTYRNGEFKSNDSRLIDCEASYCPSQHFAAFYFTNSTLKWLDFPLTKAKQWAHEYNRRTYYGIGKNPTVTASAAVSTQEITKFKFGTREVEATRIDRTADSGSSIIDATYFYSPQSKSVIKYHAKAYLMGWSSETTYELDLLDYGNTNSGESAASRQVRK